MSIHVITVCTKNQPNLEYWKGSLEKYGYTYTILGYDDVWKGWKYRTQKYVEFLHETSPYKIVICCDANDLLFVDHQKNLLEKFKRFERGNSEKIIVGAEPACCSGKYAHNESLKKDVYEKCKMVGNRYMFPNGGFVIGRAKNVLNFYTKILSYEDDQEGILDIYLSDKNSFHLDSDQHFCGNIPNMSYYVSTEKEKLLFPKSQKFGIKKEFDTFWDLSYGEKFIQNKITGGKPSVLHFPGTANEKCSDIYDTCYRYFCQKPMNRIPKIIHHMWLDKKDAHSRKYPEKYDDYVQKMLDLHPDFEYKLWSYTDVLDMMEDDPFLVKYIEFLKNDINMWICKCDFARLAVLYVHGGVYTDLDLIYQKNIGPLINDRKEYFLYEPIEHSENYGKTLIWNGFFAAQPKHPYIEGLINHITEKYDQRFDSWKDVINKTGPRVLAEYYEKYEPKFQVETSCDVTPLKFDNSFSRICNPRKESYTLTKWDEGTQWSDDITNADHNTKKVGIFNIMFRIIFVCAFVIIFLFFAHCFVIFVNRFKMDELTTKK